MSSDGITKRNKVNAQRSTGPKSERGKAVVAQNARRHGVTSKPNPTSVAAWLRIILDKRDLVPGDLMRGDRRTTWALALAEAEVKLCTSREALDQIEREVAPLSETTRELQLSAKDIAEALQTEYMIARPRSTGLSLLRRVTKDITAETGGGGKRHRLLQRYAREARGQCNRTFKAWIQCLNYGEVARVSAG